MRLIDADALLENAKKYVYQSDMATTIALGIAETWIKDAPTVDAAPVVHGRWIEDRTHIMCSVCGARYKDEIVFMPDACMSGQIYDGLERCPHCGARMDGGELNDT